MYCGQRLSASSLPSRVATASATNIRSNLPRSAVCVISAVSEIRAGVDLRVRVQPGGHVVPGRVKERTELHSLAAAFLVHPISPPEVTRPSAWWVGSVIYRPPGSAACRHQLAGVRPGLIRG